MSSPCCPAAATESSGSDLSRRLVAREKTRSPARNRADDHQDSLGMVASVPSRRTRPCHPVLPRLGRRRGRWAKSSRASGVLPLEDDFLALEVIYRGDLCQPEIALDVNGDVKGELV